MRLFYFTRLYGEINAVRVFYMFKWRNKCCAVWCGSSTCLYGGNKPNLLPEMYSTSTIVYTEILGDNNYYRHFGSED